MTNTLIRDRREDRRGEEGHEDKAVSGVSSYKPGNAGSRQELSQGTQSPHEPLGGEQPYQ